MNKFTITRNVRINNELAAKVQFIAQPTTKSVRIKTPGLPALNMMQTERGQFVVRRWGVKGKIGAATPRQAFAAAVTQFWN